MKSDSGKRQKTRHSVLGFVSSLAQSCPLLFLSHPTCQLKNKQLSACVSIADLQGLCCMIMNTQDSRRNKKHRPTRKQRGTCSAKTRHNSWDSPGEWLQPNKNFCGEFIVGKWTGFSMKVSGAVCSVSCLV